MSGAKVRVRSFPASADITNPESLAIIEQSAQLLADTLFLQREGLPCNLSALAQCILRLTPLAATDARAAAQLMARIGDINRLLAIWPALESAQAAKRHGAIGGRKPKRQQWAVEAAIKLAEQSHPTEDAAWSAIPQPGDAWQIETDEADFEVYADGGSLIAVDVNSGREPRPLKKSTFLKSYYRPARRSGM